MSKKETAESMKILNLIGKPTPNTRYSRTNNPAVLKLLKYYGNDTHQVYRWYDVLCSLGWVDTDYSAFASNVRKTLSRVSVPRKFAMSVRGNAPSAKKEDKKSKKAARQAKQESADEYEIDEELIASQAEAAMDDGMLVSLQRDLSTCKRKMKEMQAADYEKRKMIESLREELAACHPDKFKLNVEKISRRVKGTYYNILPLSDIHWGETVKPQDVNGINEYNFDIAKRRHVELFKQNYEYSQTFGCDELDIFMLGDMFSGNIHDELRENNEAPITRCIVQYYKFITGLIDAYKGCYKKVRIHCVVGNHARTTQKYQFKNKGIENYEYILYSFIENKYNESADNVTVILGDSTVLFTTVGNQSWKLEHGDRYKGGSAFVSPLSTTVRDNFKDQGMFGTTGKKFDAVMMGHWHIGGVWYLPGTTIPVYLNPSLIGPGEYSVHNLHSAFPASSYSFITDGNQVVDQRLIDLSGIR